MNNYFIFKSLLIIIEDFDEKKFERTLKKYPSYNINFENDDDGCTILHHCFNSNIINDEIFNEIVSRSGNFFIENYQKITPIEILLKNEKLTSLMFEEILSLNVNNKISAKLIDIVNKKNQSQKENEKSISSLNNIVDSIFK